MNFILYFSFSVFNDFKVTFSPELRYLIIVYSMSSGLQVEKNSENGTKLFSYSSSFLAGLKVCCVCYYQITPLGLSYIGPLLGWVVPPLPVPEFAAFCLTIYSIASLTICSLSLNSANISSCVGTGPESQGWLAISGIVGLC